MMNPFDSGIISFVSRYTHRSETFDAFMLVVMDSQLLKGGIVMAVLWWVWFTYRNGTVPARQVVSATIFASMLSVLIAKLLEHILPFRLRPLNDPSSGFLPPYGMTPSEAGHWLQSSFPSDHAALFFALAFGLLFVSRRLGLLMTLYVLLVIMVPRLYIGVHYATDIVAGAFIAFGVVGLCNSSPLRARIASPALRLEQRKPAVFYPLLFVLCYEVAVLFFDVQSFGQLARRALTL